MFATTSLGLALAFFSPVAAVAAPWQQQAQAPQNIPYNMGRNVEPTTLYCRPNQGTLDEFYLEIQPLGPNMARIHGSVMAPNTGYSVGLHTYNGQLVLEYRPPMPGSINTMAIATLPIDETMTLPPMQMPITIRVDRSFSWGPTEFICG